MKSYYLDHLDQLEAESIYIMREVVALVERPVWLFSGGKDSICLIRLAEKAFCPAKLPFPVMHIDTGHNFPETIELRDRLITSLGERLIVRKVDDSIRAGRVIEERGPYASRNALQTVTLLDALRELKFDAALGGARRDEEKARAKERVFSVRDEFGQWDPKSQRPELWNLYNGRIRPGESVRVFPLSNWTELDVWSYIQREKIEIPSIYFSHRRKCVRRRNGSLLALSPYVVPAPEDEVQELTVRFRTVGDMTCTGALLSNASTIEEVIEEIKTSKFTERGTREDDKRSESAMEDRKRQGYF
jgi:sulfate adenylyltransferase subunit 2